MKLTRYDLAFLKQLSVGFCPRWKDIGPIGLRMCEGKLVYGDYGYCYLSALGRDTLERAQLARLV
jgi:hypothetical protein